MADPLETVTVSIDGQPFGGWYDITIDYGAEMAARTAVLTSSDYAGAMPFEPGAECVLAASGETILTGYLRDVKPSHNESSHQVQLGLVSATIDAVEASIVHPTQFVKDQDLVGIANAFDTIGVGIEADDSFPVEPRSFVNSGDSLFYHIEELARSHSVLIYDTPEGKLKLGTKPAGTHGGRLAIGDGGNIIEASAVLTEQGRFNPVIVRGQSSRGTGAGALQLKAEAPDSGVKRYRPKVVVHESEATSGKLKERAERQVKRGAGYSRSAQITVAGWRAGDGRIFQPHWEIEVVDPRIYINQTMVIKSVKLRQSIENGGPGTRANLSLVDPRALGGSGGGGSSASVWNTPDVEGALSLPGGA